MNSARRSASDSARAHVTSFALAALAALSACSGGGGGGGGGGPPLAPDTGALPTTVGLVSLAANSSSVHVRWEARDTNGQSVAVALFSGVDRSSVHQGAPIANSIGDNATVVNVPGGATRYFGLALDLGGNVYVPVGTVLAARAAPPIYVDAASSAAAPDGSSPAQAFRDVREAALLAFALSGGNVWVKEGVYNAPGLQLRSGVHVYGGFDASFDLATRDPQTHPTRVRGAAGSAVCEVVGGATSTIVDGLWFDGASSASFGVDVDTAECELRSLEVSACSGRGLRLRSLDETRAIDVRLVRSRVTGNSAQGLSLSGAFDLWIEGSRFGGNGLEGLDLGGLVGPGGVPVRLRVRDCAFVGNGADGLDCDLTAPAAPSGSGRYTVLIESSSFERNGFVATAEATAGLKLDIDFELIADWRADIVVRGCSAKNNRRDGVRLDLDSTCSAFVHRLLSSANGGDGLAVSSESTPSFVSVSASVLAGNVGAGLRAELGQVPLSVSHCVLAGNLGGGLVSATARSSISSSVAWMQPNPWSGVRSHFNVESSDPLDGPFVRAPLEYLRANAWSAGQLVLADNSTLAPGDDVEFGDDGLVRDVTALGANERVSLAPTLDAPGLPSTLARFANSNVLEDYQLAPLSPALDAGMADPLVGPVDAGPFAAPLGGEPGRDGIERPTLFYAATSTPAVGQNVGASQSLRIAFLGGALASGSINPQSVRVLNAAGQVVSTTAFLQGLELVVAPPGGGWPAGALLLELHGTLQSTAGVSIATPSAFAFFTP